MQNPFPDQWSSNSNANPYQQSNFQPPQAGNMMNQPGPQPGTYQQNPQQQGLNFGNPQQQQGNLSSFNPPLNQNQAFGNQNPNPNLNSDMSMQNPMNGTSSDIHPNNIDINQQDPPLLEELDIRPADVIARLKSAILLQPLEESIAQSDGDVWEPLIIVFSFMGVLLLQGKLYMEVIYQLWISFSFFTYVLTNLMAQKGGIDIFSAFTIIGYGLLPVIIVSFIAAIISLKSTGLIGFIIAAVTILWCTATASRFVSAAIASKDQQYLIAYPCALIYTSFVVLAIF